MIFIKLICIIALILGHYIVSITLGTLVTIAEHKEKEDYFQQRLWANIWFMSWMIFSVFAILVVIF